MKKGTFVKVKTKEIANIATGESEGAMTDLLPPLLMLLSAAIIMVAFMGMVQLVNISENVKQVARGTILEMESSGYLDTAHKNGLVTSLQNMGVEQVNLSGTTTSKVGYGQRMDLYITGKIAVSRLNSSAGDMLKFFFETGKYPISIHLTSTAKH